MGSLMKKDEIKWHFFSIILIPSHLHLVESSAKQNGAR